MADGMQTTQRSRRQRDLSDIPGFNHSRRSWTTGGMHITMETATYASPGFSFRNNSSSDGLGSFNDFLQPRPRRTGNSRGAGGGGGLLGGGLLGGAINLLNDVTSSQTRRERPVRRPVRSVYVEESDDSASDDVDSEEDMAYGSLPRARTGQQKSVLGRLKDRILDHGRQHPSRPAPAHEHSPPTTRHSEDSWSGTRRRRADSPESLRPRQQQRTTAANYYETPEASPERFTDIPQPAQERRDARAENEVIALQRLVEKERTQYSRAKHRFQQASQRDMIDPGHVQHLLDQVKVHGTMLASAQRKLQAAKEQQRRNESARQSQARPQRRPSPPRQPVYESDDDDEGFVNPQSDTFEHFPGAFGDRGLFDEPHSSRGAFDPFGGFRVFDRLFADMDSSFHAHGNARVNSNGFHFFAGRGGTSFKRTTFPNTGPSSRRTRSSRFDDNINMNPQPMPAIPTNPLRAAEAAQLFKTYNNRWNALSATFPTIPYPTRTLLAPALADPSTIPHPAGQAWSTEQTMQANTALFFLLALGFKPVISDSGAVTFNRVTADEASIRALVGVLKKEKMRWHSDRLGRRNEEIADGGVNEALQQDERARAVFHGVCGLMELAIEKL